MVIRRRTEEEWRELIRAQAESGQSQAAWCTENGINYGTFIKRVLVIRKKDGVSGRARLRGPETEEKAVWVEMKAPRTANGEACGTAGNLVVEIGVFRVVIPEGFTESALKRVCKALLEIC